MSYDWDRFAELSTSFQRYIDEPNAALLIMKRYDDSDQPYLVQITTFPNTEDAQGFLNDTYVGFLKYDKKFREDLGLRGYCCYEFAELSPEYKAYIHASLIPFEWKNHMDELGQRIQVYARPTQGAWNLLAEAVAKIEALEGPDPISDEIEAP